MVLAQKQTHRSMEQIYEHIDQSPEKNPHTYGQSTKIRQEYTVEKRQSLQ